MFIVRFQSFLSGSLTRRTNYIVRVSLANRRVALHWTVLRATMAIKPHVVEPTTNIKAFEQLAIVMRHNAIKYGSRCGRSKLGMKRPSVATSRATLETQPLVRCSKAP